MKGRKNQTSVKRVPNRNLGLVMYSSPRTVMPDEFDTDLKYIVYDVVTNIGGAQAGIKFRTEAYDVDPAIASTAMPGFTEFAAFYSRYRALKLGYKFSVSNYEAFPVSILHGYTINSIASGSLNPGYAGNPLFGTAILGPATGSGKGVYSQNKSVVQIAGTTQPLYDDLYTGSTTSATLATAGTVYCNLGIVSAIPLTANGVHVFVEITLRVRFYRPNALLV